MSNVLSITFWLAIPFVMGWWPRFINLWRGRSAGGTAQAWVWLVTLCGFLVWVQVAQFILVTMTELPIAGLSEFHIPGSFAMFPLTLAALLCLYTARPAGSRVFGGVTAILAATNVGVAVCSLALGAGGAAFLGLDESLSKLWAEAAPKKVLWGAGILLVDLYVMVRLYARLRAWAWSRFTQIAVPLLTALMVDAVLFSGVLAYLDDRDYFPLLFGQGVSKFVVGVAYALVIYAYLSVYVPDAQAAPTVAAARPTDSSIRVFGHVARAMLSAILMVRTSIGFPDLGLPNSAPPVTAARVAVMGTDPPICLQEGGNVDDLLPADGPNAKAHAEAEEQFAADRARLSDSQLAGQWVAYRGKTLLDVADANREAVVRRCLDVLKLTPGQFTVFRVRPEQKVPA